MYEILKPVEGPEPLAHLFNAYLQGLSTPCVMCEPCYTTMAEVRQLKDNALKPKHKRMLKHSVKNFYALTVLGNSLRHIHQHVVAAITELDAFFATYGGDLFQYAVDKRQQSIMENGSDDESDWYRDNEADETEDWKVTRKTDPESLRHYTLHAELAWHFGGPDVGRGEYIGTSGPEAFEPYTTLVANQSAFSFRKFLAHFSDKTPQISRLQPDGSLVPMSLGDQVEEEVNQDLRGEQTTLHFNIALGFCVVIRERYQAMSPDNLVAYQSLHHMLKLVRDLDFPSEVFDSLLALP